MQEIHRARDRSLGRVVSSQREGQSPVRQEKTTDLTEPAESQHPKELRAGSRRAPEGVPE